MTASSPALPFGRYLLGPQIGMGGMGEVYVGVQRGLGGFQKVMVLKLLLPHLAEQPDSVRMFLDEAQLAAQANHPNVVEIFDVGRENGRFYIAMELVRGCSMSSLIRALAKQDQTLSPPVIQYVARALCDGLFYAHQLRGADGRPLGLIHRDVTPHNVLFSEAGEVKLTDFGIAKTRQSRAETGPGAVWGKLEYMSPEQLRGEPLDRRADIFGAGTTLFHLATLLSPYRRTSPSETTQAILAGRLPALTELRPDLPAPVAAAIVRACSSDPAQRFADAREFRDAIPPSDAEAGAEALGRLARELCGEQTVQLEGQTRQTLGAELGLSVRRASPGTRSLGGASGTGAKPPRVAWRWAAGALGLAAVAAAAFVAGQRPAPHAAASPVPAPAAPSRVVELAPPPVTVPVAPIEQKARTERETPKRRVSPLAHPQRTGYLSIDATPWATVSIDGRVVGETPLDSLPHPEGTAVVTLVCPETHRTREEKVVVSADKPVLIKADLR